jgi:hypothetical protein
MYRIVGVVLLLLPALPVAGAEDKPKDKPADQYQALIKQYQDEMNAFREAYQAAKTQEERQKAFAKYPQPDKLAPKFLDLAEKNPKDPAALDALLWVVTNVRAQGKDSPKAKALAVLSKDWVESPKIGPACQALSQGLDKQTESFLRAVLDKNPSRDAQGAACVALAEFVKNRAATVEALKERPQFAQYYENQLGKDYFQELMKLDLAKASKEAEDLYERAAAKYGDVKLARGTVADTVKPELFEIRYLAVGKKAPEIEGEDIDGKKFKLSDYKGKVVLLDFWGNW